jgi:DNA polymerase-3 subunit alpha
LTDRGNLYGSPAFYNAAKEMGIHPVLGMEAYVAPGSRFQNESTIGPQEASYEITLLAENRIGFQNLMKLSSLAYLEGFGVYPRLDKELLAAYSEGIICLSGGLSSELNQNLLSDDLPTFTKARETAGWYHKVFGEPLENHLTFRLVGQGRMDFDGVEVL